MRQAYFVTDENIQRFSDYCHLDEQVKNATQVALIAGKQCLKILKQLQRDEPYPNKDEIEHRFNALAEAAGYPLRFDQLQDLPNFIRKTCPQGDIVQKKGEPVADPALRDTENVPLAEDVAEYFTREVLPFAPDAWIDEKKTKVGYEIPFTRYFYQYEAPRPSSEIMAEILALEKELDGSLAEIFGK